MAQASSLRKIFHSSPNGLMAILLSNPEYWKGIGGESRGAGFCARPGSKLSTTSVPPGSRNQYKEQEQRIKNPGDGQD